MTTAELLRSPMFSHTRQGRDLWRDQVWIYHRDHTSPSGVILVGATTEAEMSKIDVPRGAWPLSPVEGLPR